MKRSDKLKVLIDSIKTANELMRKQIEINGRAVELLGGFITEPETLGKAPHIDNVPSLPNMVGQEIELGNEWVKDETIKPKDMKAGEWYHLTAEQYVGAFIFKFKKNNFIYRTGFDVFKGINYIKNVVLNDDLFIGYDYKTDTIRKATQEEILKYFPNELEVDTHGGNDAAYIQEVTDPQV